MHDGLELPPLRTDADRVDARRRLGLSPDRYVVLFAGQIIERKGVADLIRAWKRLAVDWASVADLILAGDDLEDNGHYRRQMEYAGHRTSDTRSFRRLSNGTLPTGSPLSDICVVPSHAEPLGNATLEAMAHAADLVASNVGGIPEMVVDDTTGMLVAAAQSSASPRDGNRPPAA